MIPSRLTYNPAPRHTALHDYIRVYKTSQLDCATNRVRNPIETERAVHTLCCANSNTALDNMQQLVQKVNDALDGITSQIAHTTRPGSWSCYSSIPFSGIAIAELMHIARVCMHILHVFDTNLRAPHAESATSTLPFTTITMTVKVVECNGEAVIHTSHTLLHISQISTPQRV